MKLKLFPLGIVAFPSKFVPLHIFEERYKKLINECIDQNSEFGVVYQDTNGLADVGCTVTVTKLLNKYPDGRMDIITQGKKIFKLKDQAVIGKLDVDSNSDTSVKFGVRNIPTLLVFKNGEVVDKMVGVVPKSQLLEKLQAHM